MNSIIKLTGSSRGFATSLKLTNIKCLVGINKDNKLTKHSNAEVAIKNGKIVEIAEAGKSKKLEGTKFKVIDTQGALVTPAFVDPHTHLFPPNDRANEFSLRGTTSYEEIAKQGGGIMSSVKAMREASFDEIYKANERIIKRFISQGTLTVEVKSGYGLDLKSELKILQVIKALKTNFKKYIDIVPTFMGAHDIPPEFKDDVQGYAKLVIEQMIPAVKAEGLAEFCDVFCENGWFDATVSEEILRAAKKNKLKIRLHADEFLDSNGAKLAAKLNAYSADHLMAVSEKGISALAKKDVIATILPGTTVFLGKSTFAPARQMIDADVKVAIGTDYNPGSCAFSSQPLMMNFAIANCKMTLEEAFRGVTSTAAESLRRKKFHGMVDEEAPADLLVWRLGSPDQIPYLNTDSAEFIELYIKRGSVFDKKKIAKIGQPKKSAEKKPAAENKPAAAPQKKTAQPAKK